MVTILLSHDPVLTTPGEWVLGLQPAQPVFLHPCRPRDLSLLGVAPGRRNELIGDDAAKEGKGKMRRHR